MANRYWVGGTGTITNSTTRWSATSGGPGGASFPTVNDIAIFDENSGGGVITFSSTSLILMGFDCRGFTGTFTCDASAGGISIRKTGNVYLRSTLNNTLAPGFLIGFQPQEVNVAYLLDVSEGANWPCDYITGSSNANSTLSVVGGPLYCRRVIIQSPTTGFNNSLNTSGNNIIAAIENANVNVYGFDMQPGTTGNLGASTIIAQRVRLDTNLVNASSVTLRVKDRIMTGNSFVCRNIELDPVSGTDVTITNRVIANKISNVNKNVPFRLIFPNINGGNNLTVADFDISGSATAVVDIRAGASAQYMQLIKSNSEPVRNVDYLRFYYVKGLPDTNTWYVGSHSTSVGGATQGLIFTDAPALASDNQSNLLFASL